MAVAADCAAPQASGLAIAVRGLTMRAGGRVLLDRASADFRAGETTLIVGCSGVGKSLLLRLLAGLIERDNVDVQVEGEVSLGGRGVRRGGGDSRVGVVFQHFALFDELSPLDNVRLAHAHRRRRAPQNETLAPAALLTELGVPSGTKTASLSGGQRQRLAIARTLAYRPEVVLYDEPTSGLDIATAEQTAKLIANTHAAHPTTSIIVTHDIEALAPIADRIFLFDAKRLALREIDLAERGQLSKLLVNPPATKDTTPAAGNMLQRGAAWAIQTAGNLLAATSRVAEAAISAPLRLAPVWRSPLWGARFFLHYLRLAAGPTAWIYLAIAGAIIGFVTTYFTFRFLPYAQYTEPLLIEDLLRSMGFAMFRILTPVLASILIAARCGAAIASDIGGKSYGRQLDALRVMNAPPARYLQSGVLYALLIGAPLLTGICYLAAAATSMVVFTANYPEYGPEFWRLHFHGRLAASDTMFYEGAGWLLAKMWLCAAGIALIAYHQGARPKFSSNEVSLAVTSTILWATLYVLVVHFGFAFYEFE